MYNNCTMVNSQVFKSKEIEKLSLKYLSDNIYIYPSKTDEIILEEYMEFFKEEKVAEIIFSEGNLSITTGYRDYNILSSEQDRHNYVYLYLPEIWSEDLVIKNSAGSINSKNKEEELGVEDYKISTNTFSAITSSGSIRLGVVETREMLVLETSSGSIAADKIASGDEIFLRSKSGGTKVDFISGKKILASVNSGSFRCNKLIEGENIEISSRSGGIRLNTLKGNNISLFSTSGAIKFEDEILANNIEVRVNSGSIKGEKLTGKFRIESTSGSMKIEELNGFGTMGSSNGAIKIEEFSSMDGDSSFFTKNGSIRLGMNREQSYYAHLKSRNGSVRTYFNDQKSKEFSDMVGSDPKNNLYIETISGSIVVD